MENLNEKNQEKIQGGARKEEEDLPPCPNCGSDDIDRVKNDNRYDCTCRACGYK